jgi:hypothetical protein
MRRIQVKEHTYAYICPNCRYKIGKQLSEELREREVEREEEKGSI